MNVLHFLYATHETFEEEPKQGSTPSKPVEEWSDEEIAAGTSDLLGLAERIMGP